MSEHYFTTPSGPERRRSIEIRAFDRQYAMTTAAGVFSADGLDLGTAVLLRTFGPPTGATRLLDLGCGWGAIAVALADRCPEAIVDAVDVNERALGLCAENARAAEVGERVRPLLPEQVDPSARYDEIWSNPPIRIGKEALHELLLQWLPHLKPQGVARLVVGRNLGADSLQRWLVDQGWECQRDASAKGFRVFSVRAAGGSPGTDSR